MTAKEEKPQFKTVHELLSHMQREMKVKKSRYNKFGEYYYRNADDIMEGVKPFLPSGASLVCSDELVLVGDRYYVKATATLDYGGLVSASAYAREDLERKKMNPEQLTGSASSFARKYALNGLFCIDDTQDADATNDHGKASKGDFKPIDKSDKPVHAEWKNAIDAINNADDSESVLEVGRYQWKRMKDLGATEQELDLIKDQAQNRSTELSNRELDKTLESKI